MKSVLRPTSIDDLDQLRQFLSSAFEVSLSAPFLNSNVMKWKYWDRRDDWSGPRGYLLERDGKIVAHAGIWPMTIGAGASAVRGVQMIDWASSRESPGAGLALVQKLSAMFDFIYSVGGSEMTRKVLPVFGFVEHSRQWKGVRLLRPLRHALTHQNRNWKLAPRLARNWFWSMRNPETSHQDRKAVRLELAGAASKVDLGGAEAHFSARPPSFFEYLLRCPVARFALYRITDSGAPAGHFAISLVRGQARVAGVWLREATRDAWASAFILTQQAAMDWKEANEVIAAGTNGPSRDGATQAGWQIMQGPTVYLLNKNKRLSLPANFEFQLSESDAAFMDNGAASYWS